MSQDALLLHHPQEGAHRGITGWVWQASMDFGSRVFTRGEKDLDDLAFTSAQFLIPRRLFHAGFPA
jgi:hypothetical protein